MSFSIGNVIINDEYYTGNDKYSDGPIEDEFLEIAKKGNFEEVLKKDNRWPILYHFSDIRENLLEWYPFSNKGELLEIGAGCGALTGLFCRKVKQVTAVELSMKRSMVNAHRNIDYDNLEILVGNYEEIEPSLGKFDYITLIGVWEYSASYISGSNPYSKMLLMAKKHLKPGGKIFIAIENKMGIKYWNGAVEDHIGRQFVSLQDYVGYENVRTFSKPEIENILGGLNIEKYTFYYPMPDYKLPEVIYTDEVLPQPGMERNYRKDYSSSRQYLFNDAIIMDQISLDKMFPYFANSFLLCIGESNPVICFSKYNKQRRPEYRTKVEIFKNDYNALNVRKTPIGSKAKTHIMSLTEKEKFNVNSKLAISSPKGYWDGNSYVTEYIEGINLGSAFINVDVEEMIERFKELREMHYKAAKGDLFYVTNDFVEWFGNVYFDKKQVSIKHTNIDLTLSNLIVDKSDELFCVDDEWTFDFPIPADYVIWRSISEFYRMYCAYVKDKWTLDDLCISVGLDRGCLGVYMTMEKHFAFKVFGEEICERYLDKYIKSSIR